MKRPRAPKEDPAARCCWICGKLGGNGATTALRWLGYDVGPGDVAHAHPKCLAAEKQKAKKELIRGLSVLR